MNKNSLKVQIKRKKKNKGFTLLEIIGVIVIIGIIIVVSGIAVVNYIEESKVKTYESFKEDLRVATNNYMIDCMTGNEIGCVMPDQGDDIKLTYEELVDKGYSKQLKDPEGEGYCDKSYVIAKNTGESGVELEYKVCLYCAKYQSEEEGCAIDKIEDKTKPTCDYTKLEGASTEWSKENKKISVGCKDNSSGCTNSIFSSSIGKEGEAIEKGQITIRDNSGNINTCEVDAYVDRKNPTCELEIIGEGNTGWYKEGVTINIKETSDEGSGVLTTGMGISQSNKTYDGQRSYTITESGIGTVFGYIKDKVGNVGECHTDVKVDTTNPTGTVYMGYEIYPKENATISGSQITINNIARYGTIKGVIIDFTSNVTTSVSGNIYSGTTSIKTSGSILSGRKQAILKISSGTYSSLKIDLENSDLLNKISKIQVIKEENVTSVWTNKDVSIYVEATDTGSGVGSYSYDNGTTYISSNVYAYSVNTSNQVKIKDIAGNESISYSFTINKIDKEAPTIPTSELRNENSAGSIRTNSNTWTNETVWWGKFSANDGSGSGVSHYEFSTNCVSPTGILYSEYTYDSNTNLTYCIRSVDNAGNASEWSSKYYIKVDKSKPSCSLTVTSGTLGNNNWYKSNVVIGFATHTDTGGSEVETYGIGGYTASKTATLSTDTTGKSYTGYIKDNAGNTNTCDISVKRDTVPPTLSYYGKCEGSESYPTCNAFQLKDATSAKMSIYRTHCAIPKNSSQTLVNYCVEGYSARERLEYYLNNGDYLPGDAKTVKDTRGGSYWNNNSILSMLTFKGSFQYAFKVCDDAGNCSDIYEYLYDLSTDQVTLK